MKQKTLAAAVLAWLPLYGMAAQEPQAADAQDAAKSATESAATELETIVVTGTRIRGGTTPSPVVTIDSERIREEGFADLGEVVRSLPQNFSGGQNPGIAAGATGGGQGNQNITGGSGLNLRGLGQDASLTLLNGRRMSYGGFVQMVDISAIPVEAVDRIDIVADGASAIYGSDAVGGVANIILRRDFDGVEVGSRYGTATDGGLTTREYTATGGARWQSGGLIATWKHSENDPIRADQRDYAQDMYAPSTLYQGGELRSGLLSAHQSLGELAELTLDAFRTQRSISTDLAYASNYEHNAPETTTSLLAPGLEVYLPGDWAMSLGGSWGREATDVDYTVVVPATGSATVSRTAYRNRSRAYELGAEGPLLALPGGDVRLALGVGYRSNAFENRNLVSGYTQVDGEVGSRYGYAELNVPLVGPQQDVAGVRRLSITGAVRGEDYDSFGGVSTPKFGVIYGPSDDVTAKLSWGKSFKVPTLSQQYLVGDAILFPAAVLGATGYAADATAVLIGGGSTTLRPERARTWSASLAFHPQAVPGLEAELSWFDIDYEDRVVQPLVPAQALGNPAFAPFITWAPTQAQLAEALQGYRFINGTGAPYVPAQVVAIASNQYVNTARQRARGVDLSCNWRVGLEAGALTFRGALTWLDSTRQVSAWLPSYDLAGTLFQPVKLSGRMGTVWQQGGFSAALFGNYKDGVTNTADGTDGASFTTFDTTLRYDTGDGAGMWSGLAFELAVQNAFNRAPPLYATTTRTYAPYDSTNYSAIGRYLSLAVSKHW